VLCRGRGSGAALDVLTTTSPPSTSFCGGWSPTSARRNLSMLRRARWSISRVEADWPLRLHLPVGSTLPPHCCASGKLLLAFKEPTERAQLVSELPLQRFTERTITDRQLLASELDRIAATGYAVDNEEYVVGVACVAVPVRIANGEVIANQYTFACRCQSTEIF
jgi:DNA-binding IclR family transcriptional regulator